MLDWQLTPFGLSSGNYHIVTNKRRDTAYLVEQEKGQRAKRIFTPQTEDGILECKRMAVRWRNEK